jgi:hypothetical protein
MLIPVRNQHYSLQRILSELLYRHVSDDGLFSETCLLFSGYFLQIGHFGKWFCLRRQVAGEEVSYSDGSVGYF